MSQFGMVVTRDNHKMDFDQIYAPEGATAFVESVLMAMREGLEANGFDVQISATYEMRLEL